MHKLWLILAVVMVFIIAQYSGISAINILNNHPTKSLELGNSGLVATNVGSNVYIAWSEFTDKEIILASSTPSRFTIDEISNNSLMPLSRSIDASGSNVYITWVDDYLHPSKLLLSEYSNNGLDTKVIRDTDYVLDYPIVVANGPIVYIAWLEYIDGNYQVLLRYSHDNGNTFSDIVYISNPENDASSISIDAEGSNVYLAWHEVINGKHKVLLRYSHDNGNTFSDIIVMNKNNHAGFPVLDAEGSNVYLAWIEKVGNDRNIVLMTSNDDKNFDEVLRIDTNGTLPALDIDGPLVCLSWFELYNSIRLNVACSIDNEQFNKHLIAEGNMKMHKINVEGSNVYISWVEGEESKQFNLAASYDAGKSFNQPLNLAVGDINNAGVIASGSNVYAIWSELYCLGFRCNDIETNVYARVSYDTGKSFEESFSLG